MWAKTDGLRWNAGTAVLQSQSLRFRGAELPAYSPTDSSLPWVGFSPTETVLLSWLLKMNKGDFKLMKYSVEPPEFQNLKQQVSTTLQPRQGPLCVWHRSHIFDFRVINGCECHFPTVLYTFGCWGWFFLLETGLLLKWAALSNSKRQRRALKPTDTREPQEPPRNRCVNAARVCLRGIHYGFASSTSQYGGSGLEY